MFRSVSFIIGCLVLGMAALHAADNQPVKHVVLISVDGLSASYLSDPRAEMPNLRGIADQGASASGMMTTFPSVTWPSHTSLVTGMRAARHGVIGNTVWNREKNGPVKYIGDPELTKDQSIQVPTLYDVAHQNGMTTASIIWPCSNGAKTLDWIIPDSNKPELHQRYTTPGLAEDLAKADIDISQLGEWGWGKQYSTQRDIVYANAVQHLLKRHNINLILLHLITPDGVEHAYGPNTPQAFQAVAESDQRIGEIWAALQQPPFLGESALFIVSDHGFAAYQKLIRPNVILSELGLIESDNDNKITDRSAWCVAQGGSAFIYILDENRREELIETLTKEFTEVEGIQAIMHPAEFVELGLPSPDENPEAPDLVLTTGPGYSFADDVSGEVVVDAGGNKGTHGHDPRPDYMHATFVAAGAGIQPGAKLGVINNVDVAPTIAYLMGFDMEADGHVLHEALSR